MVYGSWDVECDRQNFLSCWTIFCTFTPLTTQKMKILKKWKKQLEILSLHTMYNINDNHIMYGIWDMKLTDRIFSNFGHFLPFYSSHYPRNQNFEKQKKTPGDIIILHKCTKNHDHVLYCSQDMVCNRFNYFSFWAIFCPFTSLTAPKIKILKKWKKTPGDIIILK